VEERQFYIGTPLDMETKVRLSPAELVKRSNGVFGKSGTGKTFLSRLKNEFHRAGNLVFDLGKHFGNGH
jgi:DNA helicase HerA-like ATPase